MKQESPAVAREDALQPIAYSTDLQDHSRSMIFSSSQKAYTTSYQWNFACLSFTRRDNYSCKNSLPFSHRGLLHPLLTDRRTDGQTTHRAIDALQQQLKHVNKM